MIFKKPIMFLFAILLAFSFSFFVACDSDSGTGGDDGGGKVVTVTGNVEKGALQKGAEIDASQWSAEGGYSGKIFKSLTVDNLGGYVLSGTGMTGLLDVEVDGFFINENTGTVSDSRIILKGLIDSSKSTGNINIITHIVMQRVINLIQAGSTFDAAYNQAVGELYSGLSWSVSTPLDQSVSTNAKLLFLSAAVCRNRTVDQVSNILTILANDLIDGVVDLSILDRSFYFLNCTQIEANMTAMYHSCPALSEIKNQVIAHRNIQPPYVAVPTKTITLPVQDFYFFENSTKELSGALWGTFGEVQLSVEFDTDGVIETKDIPVNDFFSVGAGSQTIKYFSAIFSEFTGHFTDDEQPIYAQAERFYKKELGVVAEITEEEIPARPVKPCVHFNTTNFYSEDYVYEGEHYIKIYDMTPNGPIPIYKTVDCYSLGARDGANGLYYSVTEKAEPTCQFQDGLYFWAEGAWAPLHLKPVGKMWID